jgi:hypothetical protein
MSLIASHLTHLHVVVDGSDVQGTAAIIVGGVDSVGPLDEEPAHQVLAPRHDGLVQWVVPFHVTDPEVGAVCPEDAQCFQLALSSAAMRRPGSNEDAFSASIEIEFKVT